ncbi:MAG TPA: DUF58 domain-containing protein [Longimicrobiales bacterium]|nr:DUF58 domain-containing protein [Longimicrobiales bacterium]
MLIAPWRRALDWLRPRRAPAISPDVLREVRGLELRTRGLVDSMFAGGYASIFHGRGLEFSHVRSYQVGDDVRAIDWKVTARRGAPFVRQFVEERDLLVVLVVDVSGSGRFGPGERSPSEVAAEIAAALAFAAQRNNDRISLLLVSDRVEHFVPPGSGRRHVVGLLAQLIAHEPRGSGTDLSTALERLSRRRGDRATVFVISDFIQSGPASPFRDALMRLARGNDLVAIRLVSGAQLELPSVGWIETTDPETGRRVLIDASRKKVREHYRHSVLRAQADTAALLGEVGAELVDVNTASDPLAALSAFFRRRRGTFS